MLSKIMVLKQKTAPQRMVILEQVRVQFIGELPFITGVRMTGLAPEETWLKGVPVWYPLGDIMHMAEFESYEELKRAEMFQKVLLESLQTPSFGDSKPKKDDVGQFTAPSRTP